MNRNCRDTISVAAAFFLVVGGLVYFREDRENTTVSLEERLDVVKESYVKLGWDSSDDEKQIQYFREGNYKKLISQYDQIIRSIKDNDAQTVVDLRRSFAYCLANTKMYRGTDSLGLGISSFYWSLKLSLDRLYGTSTSNAIKESMNYVVSSQLLESLDEGKHELLIQGYFKEAFGSKYHGFYEWDTLKLRSVLEKIRDSSKSKISKPGALDDSNSELYCESAFYRRLSEIVVRQK